ncbi:GatB/YqeY domain-containing protein [Schleiferilactobacillus perolens]|nr:GatB/YqeY domain-containing protein [Schleiferilactobacillus perolens]
MSLLDSLNTDMITAMKAKDKTTLSVIRMIKAALQNEKNEVGRDLTDAEELGVITREMKQRKESLEEFEKANREDLVTGVKAEIAVVEKYMPKQMDDAAIKQTVQDTITEVGATGKADFGKVMKALMPKVKGKADGAKVNAYVKELLG